MAKFVYSFSEGNADMRNLLGGKGANLAEMTRLGMPIPQGFTITTEACNDYYSKGKKIDEAIVDEIIHALRELESLSGKTFGGGDNPLLLSVRSGARVSMPGMMDTILNLGMNDAVAATLADKTGNPRFAYDSYRRFIQMFSDVVMEVPNASFERALDRIKKEKGAKYDMDLDAEDLLAVIAEFKSLYRQSIHEDFPSDPHSQLIAAVQAVFRSWNTERAIYYRRMNDIPSNWGTAVNVQMMVFGNMGDTSGTGVAFTRDPATGEKKMFGEYLINAQGEDVVAGIRTPRPIAVLEQDMPDIYKQFLDKATQLERHYRDMQDMEFTIENGRLYLLQTRNGKRTAAAALKIAVDLVDEGLLSEKEALLKVEPKQLDQLLHPGFDPAAIKSATPIGTALPASPGSAAGKIYFTAEDAKAAHTQRGERVILVRLETSPEDIEGMAVSEGILTARGGRTSHAAVVARGMGTCCVAGCGDAEIDEHKKTLDLNGHHFTEGDYLSLDGTTGNIYAGDLPTVPAVITGDFGRFMDWADQYRQLQVRANADTPQDAMAAIRFGAEGIGLSRTEHMFFNEDRIPKMQEMILSGDEAARCAALEKLLPYQRDDFIGIYETMLEHPVTIRLLDPPLHEFLPKEEATFIELARNMDVSVAELKTRAQKLHEFNPMMGHRGCRLCITYPEIAEMQVRAIMEAAIAVQKTKGCTIVPEIMIPLVGDVKEFRYVAAIIRCTADQIIAESGVQMKYLVGTMIEVPRATLTADKIAEEADFFSFGTNDLTQTTLGFSRDDAGSFLDDYYKKQIYESDPFSHIDVDGVGQLIHIAVEKGRAVRPSIMMGVCGEHGGDPASVAFFHEAGVQYVSCSPFRVPIARLAAAQAAITVG